MAELYIYNVDDLKVIKIINFNSWEYDQEEIENAIQFDYDWDIHGFCYSLGDFIITEETEEVEYENYQKGEG